MPEQPPEDMPLPPHHPARVKLERTLDDLDFIAELFPGDDEPSGPMSALAHSDPAETFREPD